MLGNTLEARVGPAALDHLGAMLAETVPTPRSMFAFETVIQRQGEALDVIVHLTNGVVVVELEPRVGDARVNPLTLVQGMVASLQDAATASAFVRAIADAVHRATGFDRVMVYQFQDDESGAVVAEARGPDIESYLGLRYPASDIPKQARALYLKNWMRLIPDARYTPAPINPPINPVSRQPLDLTHSILRSVSPLHLEYLANMGVVASMSLSLVVGGKLWGLIACHHSAPMHMPHTLRSACELFAHMASLQLAEKIASDEHSNRLQAAAMHTQLVEWMTREEQVATALIQQRPNLLDYVSADGVVVWWDGRASAVGRAPSEAQIADLVAWLNTNVPEGVFVTDRLVEHYPPAERYQDVASGLVALSISRSPRDYVLWFRPEIIETITWAGNPGKAVEVVDGAARLGPRKSFAAWRETVRGRSQPWRAHTIEAAHALRISILEVVLQRLDQAAREREVVQSRQDFLMAELDHRVKNIIMIIQSLARFSAASAVSLEDFTRTFQQRLHSMARAQSLLSQSRWEGAPLRTIIEDEVAPFFGQQRVTVTGPDVLMGPKPAQSISLAIHELATNAAKYGAWSIPEGRVEVIWKWQVELDRQLVRMTWTELGGPPVKEPSRIGFRRTLLQRILKFDLGGEVDLRFEPTGLVCTIVIPFEQIAEAKWAAVEAV